MQFPYTFPVHIIGAAGTEGSTLLRYLSNKHPKETLVAHNNSSKEAFLKQYVHANSALGRKQAVEQARFLLQEKNISWCFDKNYLSKLDSAGTIFVPQSWYLYQENDALKKYSNKFSSLTSLYFRLFPGKIVGITGSNGKTTTTNMVKSIFEKKYPSMLCSGNDRRYVQVLEKVEHKKPKDWLILEVSNRQLHLDLKRSPDISIITNITPNHMNEYDNFAQYAAVKASLIQHQTPSQWAVLNADDPESQRVISRCEGNIFPFSVKEHLSHGAFIKNDFLTIKHGSQEEYILAVKDLPLLGEHNISNALAASASAYLAGIPKGEIADGLRSLESLPQRLEYIGEHKGIHFYNDSSSTVPESSRVGMKAITTKHPNKTIFCIGGGHPKNASTEEYFNFLHQHKNLIPLWLKSPISTEWKEYCKKYNKTDQKEFESLQNAFKTAVKCSKKGDVIVLSPGAEFFKFLEKSIGDIKLFRHYINNL